MSRLPPTPASRSSHRKAAPPPPPRQGHALRGAHAHELSLVAAFDDLVRGGNVLAAGGCEKEFLGLIRRVQAWRKNWMQSEKERAKLHRNLQERDNELRAKEYKIKQARKLLEDERQSRLAAEADRDSFAKQLDMLKDILLTDGNRGGFDNETLERLRHIDTTKRNSPFKNRDNNILPAVEESMESILDVSDLSFDETREGLDEDAVAAGNKAAANRSRRASARVKEANKRRSSARFTAEKIEEQAKKRRSRSMGKVLDDQVLTTTTRVTIGKDGVPHAESVIESVPANVDMSLKELKRAARKSRESRGECGQQQQQQKVTYNDNVMRQEFSPTAPPCPSAVATAAAVTPIVRRHYSNAGSIPTRPHCFAEKYMNMTERCGPCGKRIKFRKIGLKCRDCGLVTHKECRADAPTPCIAASAGRTPTNKAAGNALADYTPSETPMVPAILVHCLREVEARGLTEVGVYRIPGNESEANDILGKFLRGKCAPSLARADIHAVASAAKKFLRSLKEPVIPLSLWRVFVDAANNPDTTDAEAAMYQAVSELPRPNRETLAFLVLHLQKVADSPDCKMPADNLAMVMGPTIVGYSSADPMAIMAEAGLQKAVMRLLISMTSDYWANFLQYEQENVFPRLNTPEVYQERNNAYTPYKSAIAKRTRSRQLTSNQYFQSPMLF